MTGVQTCALPISSRAFGAGLSGLGWGFALFALAEISYMTYHLDWTTFLFAHTISEVLDLLAIIGFFVAAVSRVTGPAAVGSGPGR